MSQGLRIVPMELRDAKAFVTAHHRHHKGLGGHRFSVGVVNANNQVVGVAIAGRPVSGTDPRKVIEVTRCCTDGTRNACSMLYSAVCRAAKSLGYEVAQTYIFDEENGASLKASGWHFERMAHPSGRHRKRADGKQRNTDHVEKRKQLWRKQLLPSTGQLTHYLQKESSCEA